MKNRYILLMSKALDAYTDEHIKEYFDRVKKEGLTEHGFPRLTANMGILISHGIRTELKPLFCEMMEFCCKNIPYVKAANDFSVKELVFCIMELEASGAVDREDVERYKAYLSKINPETCYNVYAKAPEDVVFNWAIFTAVSEHMRKYIGIGDQSEFIDVQLASQLKWLDENGMYCDDFKFPPMVYDIVSRGLFAVMLDFGYNGKYRAEIDGALKKSGMLTLGMQSVSGEIPYGGRSNQFLHNEAQLAILFEYEAKRYARENDPVLAGKFKKRVEVALDNIALWLDKHPVRHIKNRFPTETKYGCEDYAYFDKYMITVASFLYAAYLICDDGIEAVIEDELPNVCRTSNKFNKLFLKSNGYFLELDTDADPKYDASGLGRVHRLGAPSAICMSLPCPSKPNFVTNAEPKSLSLAPAIFENGEWLYGFDEGSKHKVISLESDKKMAKAELECIFSNGRRAVSSYTVDENGVTVRVKGEGSVGFSLPALSYDGEKYTDIILDRNMLCVSYEGWCCRYTVSGGIKDTEKTAYNRSGHYRAFIAEAINELEIKIEISKI